MSNFDVRGDLFEEIKVITFADESTDAGTTQGYMLTRNIDLVKIKDDQEDFVYITSKEHALNLIKALQKAIELKWII